MEPTHRAASFSLRPMSCGDLRHLARHALDDAFICALLTYLFNKQLEAPIAPGANVPVSDERIWVPGD